jgi:hypothetical protein
VDQPDSKPIWPWSKGAVKAFLAAATRAGQRFHIPSGLDAALLIDLPELCQALTRFRVDLLTGDSIKPRKITFKFPKGAYTLDEEERLSVPVKLTRKLMLNMLALEDVPQAPDPSNNGALPPAIGGDNHAA